MEKLNVKNVIISKQGENSENYEKFKQIVKKKKIKVIVVKKRRWNNNWKRIKNSDYMAKKRANTGKYFKQ